MTTIYKALKKDHEKHRELLNKIAETSGDSPERRELYSKFFYDVSAHAAAEEEAFYSPLMEKPMGQPEARHSVAEHKQLDDIMKELMEMDMSSTGWLTRFRTLKHDYEHHMEEEENEIFEQAKKSIGSDKSGEIADEFIDRKAAERKLVDKKAAEALAH